MKKILFCIIVCFMLIKPVQSANTAILATVNDDIITSYDFYNRMNMAFANAGLDPTQENIQRVSSGVIQELIYEKLQLQSANEAGIIVTEEEVNNALLSMAKQNQVSFDTFKEQLEINQIDISTLKDQIISKISWNKYIARKITPQVNVSDEEIDEFIKQFNEQTGKKEYLVDEVFYEYLDDEDKASLTELLKSFLEEITEDSNKFAELSSAIPFNKDYPNKKWLSVENYPKEIQDKLMVMQTNQISDVIETEDGLSIIKLVDVRTVALSDEKITKEQAKYRLTMEKIDILAKRQLRDLKDSSFIEIKQN